MNPISQKLKSDWRAKENIELMQKRRRRYLHFDEVLECVSPAVFRKITNPTFIEKYGFFPLLKRIQKNRLYKRDPVTKKKIIKSKERPISYAAHFDSLVYSWYAYQLEALYESSLKREKIDDSVIAYRKLNKSNLDFAKEVFDFISNQQNVVAIALDIKGFYDNLDHKLAKRTWASLLGRSDLPLDHYKVYKSVTDSACVAIDELRKILGIGTNDFKKMRYFLNINLLEKIRTQNGIEVNNLGHGIPQGTPISCVLSNLYMFSFDISISRKVREIGGLYRRYSDDIIVVCPPEKKDEVLALLLSQIAAVKLEIEMSKTDIRFFKKVSESKMDCTDEKNKESKLQYLGVEYDGSRMTLRHKGYAKFERKMTHAIRKEVRLAKERKVAPTKRKLYERFTPLGKMNYVTYANKASFKLNSPIIAKSVTHGQLTKKIKKRIKEEL